MITLTTSEFTELILVLTHLCKDNPNLLASIDKINRSVCTRYAKPELDSPPTQKQLDEFEEELKTRLGKDFKVGRVGTDSLFKVYHSFLGGSIAAGHYKLGRHELLSHTPKQLAKDYADALKSSITRVNRPASTEPHPSLHANEMKPPMNPEAEAHIRRAFAKLYELPEDASWEAIYDTARLSINTIKAVTDTPPQEDSLSSVKAELAEYKKKYGGLE